MTKYVTEVIYAQTYYTLYVFDYLWNKICHKLYDKYVIAVVYGEDILHSLCVFDYLWNKICHILYDKCVIAVVYDADILHCLYILA